MKNSPIKAISYCNGLLYSKSNVLYLNSSKLDLNNEIIDILVSNDKIIIVFKRQICILSKNLDLLAYSDIFSANITAISFNVDIYILLYNGMLLHFTFLDFNSLLLVKQEFIFNKTITSAFIAGDKVIIGSFDSIYQYVLNNQENKFSILFEKTHSGRIFNIYTCGDDIFSCADDRSICINGKKTIQVYRDYFFHIQCKNDKVYTLNRDGYFRIYDKFKNYELIYSEFFEKESLTTLFINDDICYLGTKSGCIYKYHDFSIHLISGPSIVSSSLKSIDQYRNIIYFYKPNCIFENGFLTANNFKFKLDSRPLDFDYSEGKFYLLYLNYILIVENGNVISEIDYQIDRSTSIKGLPSKISTYKQSIYIYNNSIVYNICAICFDLVKVYECNNINIVRAGIIGTKYGCIIINDRLVKVSEYSIRDIQIVDEHLYILDSNSCLFKTNNFKGIGDSVCCVKISFHENNSFSDFSYSDDLTNHNPNLLNSSSPLKIENNNHLTEIFSNLKISTDKESNKTDINNWLELRKNYSHDLIVEYKDASMDPKLIKLNINNSNDEFSYSYEKYPDFLNKNCRRLKFYKKDSLKIKNIFSFKTFKNVENIESTGFLGTNISFYQSFGRHIEKFIVTENIQPLTNFFDFTSLGEGGNLKILGNEHGQIFLIKEDIIQDFTTLNGSIINIYFQEDNIFIFTRPGHVYSLEIFKNQIFIKNSVDLGIKITCSYETIACFSNGEILYFDKDLNYESIVKTECFISCIYKNLITYSGKFSYLNNLQAERCLFNKNVQVIRNINNLFVAAGDDQTIRIFNGDLKELKKAVIHSAQIFDILVNENFIFTLSSDMRICVLDHDLKVMKYIKHTVRNPKFMTQNSIDLLVLYGESIEEVHF